MPSDSKSMDLFSARIFPNFPFQREDWLAVAFERDNYDNARLPEDFFEVVSEEFRAAGESTLLIKGYGEMFDRLPGQILEIEFCWAKYRQAVLSPPYYSVEYKLVGVAGSCACWADPELTVWGGGRETMSKVITRLGGERNLLDRMLKDFYLTPDGTDNEELRRYLRRLIKRDSTT